MKILALIMLVSAIVTLPHLGGPLAVWNWRAGVGRQVRNLGTIVNLGIVVRHWKAGTASIVATRQTPPSCQHLGSG